MKMPIVLGLISNSNPFSRGFCTVTGAAQVTCNLDVSAPTTGTSSGNTVIINVKDDLGNTGPLQRLCLGRTDHRALFQDQRSLAQGVHGHPANRLIRTGRTEFHAASSFSLGGKRNCAVISAMIDTSTSYDSTPWCHVEDDPITP